MLTIETFKQNWKRYLWSIGITFWAGFLTAVLSVWQGVTLDSFSDGSIMVLVFGSVRTAMKLALEVVLMFLTQSEKLKSMGTEG